MKKIKWAFVVAVCLSCGNAKQDQTESTTDNASTAEASEDSSDPRKSGPCGDYYPDNFLEKVKQLCACEVEYYVPLEESAKLDNYHGCGCVLKNNSGSQLMVTVSTDWPSNLTGVIDVLRKDSVGVGVTYVSKQDPDIGDDALLRSYKVNNRSGEGWSLEFCNGSLNVSLTSTRNDPANPFILDGKQLTALAKEWDTLF